MTILEKGEKTNPCYGLYEEYIDDEMINALKEGKRLYMEINFGEYAVVIKLKKGKKKGKKNDKQKQDSDESN